MNTNAIFVISVSSVIILIESASLIKKNDTLELLKNDVSKVGSAVENFTFDILREILVDSEETEATTMISRRTKRSAEDDVRQLCQKRCEATQKEETKQIKELKDEMKKLQDMVKLMQNQQKIMNILDEDKNKSPKQMRAENEAEEIPESSNGEKLAKMKKDLQKVITSLNETRELIELQKKKDEILEEELVRQNEEILKLQTTVASILVNTTTNITSDENHQSNARSSELSSIRKLLKSLPEDDDDDDGSIRGKLRELQKQLKKKRQQQSLLNELKELEKSIDEENSGDGDLLKQIIKAIKKTEAQSRSDDIDVNNLGDLQDAINRLRPKENEANQFQVMLNKLINNNRPPTTNPKPSIPVSGNKNNLPYICVVNDPSLKNIPQPTPFFNNRQYYSPASNPQFFPSQFIQQNPYPQGITNGGNYEKSGYNTGENDDANQRYQQELRQQIDGLQAAIDNMNKPEYFQRPEDKAVVDDLEKQIADLRNVVNNLNYDGSYQTRAKRSLEDNKIESEEYVKKMNDIVGKLLSDDEENPKKGQLEEIQDKIDNIKNKLDQGNSKSRTAAPPGQLYTPPDLLSYDLLKPPMSETTRSFKNDFFADIIGKILDKIIAVIPVVIQKIFSFSFQELSKYDYQDYDVQVLFKNLGIFAYLPVILLRIVRGISAFMKMLKKNSFFKNFLMPALILGTIAGSVIFLIWWLQPDGESNSYGYVNYDDQSGYSQNTYASTTNNNVNQYPVSYNTPVYNRSYFNK